ncbi:MAG: transglutaminase family protein [Gammaproteobacteria bacterium]|nr:transglutaminase family protein [Gammaproteobacteria bacterium]MCP5459275.1 transglutaminase family protein [Gammaproteobacteria bacterium]
MRHLQITHTTTYEYSEIVTLQPHRLLLRPREGHDLRIESSQLEITPAHMIKWQRDVYGNSVGIVQFLERSKQLSIFSGITLKHYEDQPLDFWVEDYAVNFPFQYDPVERIDLSPYVVPIFLDDQPAIGEWLRKFWQPGQVVETYLLLDWINKALANNFTYCMREEPGVQTPGETLSIQGGSCRDYATLFIEACRYFGLAARFVSGYLYSPETVLGDGSTHAWSEVYLPGAGWKGFDSTSGLVVGNDHIAVAVHRHPEEIPPVSGTFLAAHQLAPNMRVTVQVVETEVF